MFKLETSLRITKELLLSKNSQETYFEHYLGITIKKGLFCSPSIIRVDRTPTCSFYKDKNGNLVYKDFAGPTFNFIGAVMHIFNCTYYTALRIIANDFGFVDSPKLEKNITKIQYSGIILKETEKAKIQVEIKDFSEKEITWWSNFGISLNTLNKFKVFSIKSVFLNGFYHTSSTETSPIYGYFGGTNSDGDELWRLYMPSKKKYRFLSNWSSSRIQGSRQLPKSGNHCIFIKSMKDLMLLHEFGIIALSTISENVLISNAQFKKINERFGDNQIVFFDNDLAGVRGAKRYKKEYNIRCIFIKRKYSKDISDLYKKVSSNVFWGIIDELDNILINKSIKQTKHFYVF